MSRRPDLRRAALVAIVLADAAALLMLLSSANLAAGTMALGAHAGLTLFAWLTLAPGSRRTLGVTWFFALPGAGGVVALAGLDLRGEGDLRQFDRGQVAERPIAPRQLARMAASQVPTCEQLVSGAADERRTALATLTARGDADAIEILRWAVRQPDGELALEAALALEELAARHEARRVDTRRRLAEAPSYVAALAAGDVLLDAIRTRLVEPALVPTLADEARAHYEQALRLDPSSAGALLARRARIELAALRPENAVQLLERVVRAPGADAELAALYHDAAVAARRGAKESHGGVAGA